MKPLKNMSRKTIAAISLLVWFAPSFFLLSQLAKNGGTPLKNVEILPMMYGFTLLQWLRWLFQVLFEQRWFHWTLAVIISVGLPVALVVLMLRTSRRRPVVLVAGLTVSCALTAAAYCLLRA
jgi:hypothetical protein